ncbi:MAG: flagellar filament capping protein FliD [Acidobacteriia bacterium]|nr:flagellar filament capping protein FliD [Terriglobia bacterium]
MAFQTAQLQGMQSQQSQLTTEQNALTSFSNDLQALSNAAFTLTDPAGPLTSVAATSSNPSVLTATAISGSANAAHSITVTNLATTSSAYSAAVATSSTAIATGSLSIQVGSGTAVPVTIDSSNNTLDKLAQTINSKNMGVTATVINDASGARLAIVSNTSGAPGDLTITSSGGALSFTKGVTGTNASLTVDGIPISSTTNTVTSVIPGVTLNLAAPAPGAPVTVNTGPNVTPQAAAVNSFVSAYNTVMGDLNKQFTVDGSGQAGPLAADSTLILAQNQLLSSMAFAMKGNGSVNMLADLGITMNNDGTLSVNNSALSSALQNNPAAVQAFFQATTAGSFGANLSQDVNLLADPTSGSVTQDMTGLQQSQSDLSHQISDFQGQLAITQQQLTAQFDQVDVMLQTLPMMLTQISQQLGSLG